jgi:hypothetical protein
VKKERKKTGKKVKGVEEFFTSDLANRAASPLSQRARIALHSDSEHWLFRREKQGNVLEACGEEVEADVHFWLPPSSLSHLLECGAAKDATIGSMGMAVVQRMLTAEAGDRIRFRVESGFLGLWSKGYFSVLSSGGPELAKFLGAKGFRGLSAIKSALNSIRGGHAGR